jgi:hypothetical protein
MIGEMCDVLCGKVRVWVTVFEPDLRREDPRCQLQIVWKIGKPRPADREQCLVATPAAATAATSAAVSAATTATAAALHLGAGLVDVQRASAHLGTVQGGDRFVSLFRVGHFHKTKPA